MTDKFVGAYYFFFERLYLFLERGEGREREKERNSDVREKHRSVALVHAPVRDQTRNPGFCPSWASQTSDAPLFGLTPNQQATPARPLMFYQCSALEY